MEKGPKFLEINKVYCGDCRQLIKCIQPNSIALSLWSPPYHVGKEYEQGILFLEWQLLLEQIIGLHKEVLRPGGFLVINIADILCFSDKSMPRIQAANVSKHRSPVTQEQVLKLKKERPHLSRYELAAILNCSEQTIDRRLNGNNIRGGKYITQTRVKLVGSFIEEAALKHQLYLYDYRIWQKDLPWANNQWHSSSYRSVNEFEHLFIFWKPGVTVVDRNRLRPEEWSEWGSRAVWTIPSVHRNNDHPAKFPLLLAKRFIRLLSEKNDLVLDPFLGSGTTAVAAIEAGRSFIGFEKELKYCKLAEQKIKAAQELWFNGET